MWERSVKTNSSLFTFLLMYWNIHTTAVFSCGILEHAFLDVAELFLVPWGQSAGSSAEQELAGYSVLFKDMSAVASAGSGARWVNQFKKSLSALCSHVWETCSYLHSLICCGLSFPVRAPLYTIRNIQQMLHMHVVVWVDTLNSSLYAGKKNKWHFEILMQFVTL